ncbi:hypothetical protein H1Q63_31660 [Desmonostoc muscorum CCALA 125]|nr:hypothetical protein [Desmonostoc muscorum CCALA 125]
MIFKDFFTLPLFKEDTRGERYIFWQVDQKSQNYIVRLVSEQPDLSKPQLVKILLHNLENYPDDQFNRRVWIAFLAKFSYKAAFKIRTNILKVSSRTYLDYDSLFNELFQIALTISLSPEKCLYIFFQKDDEYDNLALNIWYYKFEKYLSKRMEGLLCDRWREIEGFRTFQRSDLGLAARATKTRVITVLKRLGFNEVTISHYILAWQCFREANDAKIINISSPQPQAFEEICRRYHQFSHKLPNLSPNQIVDGTVIQQWLQEIGRAIRNYVDFAQISLDEPISQDSETLTWVDLIPDENSIIQRDAISRNEIEDYVKQLREFIYTKIELLKPKEQIIPLFIHGLALSQEKIGIEISANQSTVGRRYKKMLMDLLTQLGIWAHEHLQVDINSEKLSELKAELQEYLDVFYQNLIYSFLGDAIQLLESHTKDIMRLFWLEKMKMNKIAELLNFPVLEIERQLLSSHQSLQLNVVERIEARIDMFLNPQGVVWNQVDDLIDEWLKIADFT